MERPFSYPKRGERMQVSSRITIDTVAVNQLCELAKEAPRDKGTLQNEAMFVDKSQVDIGRVSIVHSEPYARRWYFNPENVPVNEYTVRKGKRAGKTVRAYTAHKATFSQNENPNAKDHWFEDWQEGGKHGDFCRKKFKFFYKRLLRGAGR